MSEPDRLKDELDIVTNEKVALGAEVRRLITALDTNQNRLEEAWEACGEEADRRLKAEADRDRLLDACRRLLGGVVDSTATTVTFPVALVANLKEVVDG